MLVSQAAAVSKSPKETNLTEMAACSRPDSLAVCPGMTGRHSDGR